MFKRFQSKVKHYTHIEQGIGLSTTMHIAHLYSQMLLKTSCFECLLGEEVISNSNESVSGPALEPIHGAARDQTRELERSATELLSHLRAHKTTHHVGLVQ